MKKRMAEVKLEKELEEWLNENKLNECSYLFIKYKILNIKQIKLQNHNFISLTQLIFLFLYS